MTIKCFSTLNIYSFVTLSSCFNFVSNQNFDQNQIKKLHLTPIKCCMKFEHAFSTINVFVTLS